MHRACRQAGGGGLVLSSGCCSNGMAKGVAPLFYLKLSFYLQTSIFAVKLKQI